MENGIPHDTPHGTGPGEIAPDGSAVEFYRALGPDETTAALVHEAVPDGASVLDLGAGTGRTTHPLLALGHPVTAVDHSAQMLAHIRGASTVCARIQDLDLGRVFDAVLLASYIIEYADVPRETVLDACRRHVAADGLVLIQRMPPGSHATAEPGAWERDGVRFRMDDIERHGDGVMSATMEYRIDDRAWTHSYTSRELSDDEIPTLFVDAGLRLDGFLDPEHAWVRARPA